MCVEEMGEQFFVYLSIYHLPISLNKLDRNFLKRKKSEYKNKNPPWKFLSAQRGLVDLFVERSFFKK